MVRCHILLGPIWRLPVSSSPWKRPFVIFILMHLQCFTSSKTHVDLLWVYECPFPHIWEYKFIEHFDPTHFCGCFINMPVGGWGHQLFQTLGQSLRPGGLHKEALPKARQNNPFPILIENSHVLDYLRQLDRVNSANLLFELWSLFFLCFNLL